MQKPCISPIYKAFAVIIGLVFADKISAICNIYKKLTPHCSRHTFACNAIEYGMPIDIIAKIIGHSNTNMTSHYAKFSKQAISRKMSKPGKIMGAHN